MKTILTLIALTISVAAFSQTRLRAETYSYHYKVDGTWEEWSKDYISNDIIVFDYSKDKITIHATTTLVYDIITYIDDEKKGDGHDVYMFVCVDGGGRDCVVGLMHMDDPWINEIYVYYEDFSFKYKADFIVD